MKDNTAPMSGLDEPSNVDIDDVDTEIESLARETRVPRALVESLYSRERAKLERTARIKTFVPVLIHRHVKAILREQYRT
jgi:hypothetical protein